ncbi:MAG: shikimate kinase [Candidatus Dormibacterales bacterium]
MTSRSRPVVLVGFMGSGKSVVGALVAARAGAPFRDLDQMIEVDAGEAVAAIFATRGEKAFRAIEKRLLPRALEPGAVVALGGGAIMDDESWLVVRTQALPVYLEVPFDAIWSRVAGAQDRPLIAGRTRAEVEALFEARRRRYEESPNRVGGGRAPEVVADEVLKLWSD